MLYPTIPPEKTRREPFYDFRLSNTGVTKIDFYEPGTNKYGDMVFDYVNRTGHLL